MADTNAIGIPHRVRNTKEAGKPKVNATRGPIIAEAEATAHQIYFTLRSTSRAPRSMFAMA
jgi:hypothetical protein